VSAEIQIVSNENAEPTPVIVPIELWRKVESEQETAYLLRSDAMKARLLAAKQRGEGIPAEATLEDLVTRTLLTLAQRYGLNVNSPKAFQLLENLDMLVEEFVGKYRLGSIKQAEGWRFEGMTVKQALESGGRKLLTDGRFDKQETPDTIAFRFVARHEYEDQRTAERANIGTIEGREINHRSYEVA
jgi:hypothetical protein